MNGHELSSLFDFRSSVFYGQSRFHYLLFTLFYIVYLQKSMFTIWDYNWTFPNIDMRNHVGPVGKYTSKKILHSHIEFVI